MTKYAYDVIIIGGGIVGLTLAYQIKLKYKDKSMSDLNLLTEL